MSVLDWVSGRVFKFVHGNNLVYNTCWEDPALDRIALQLTPSDTVMVISSAVAESNSEVAAARAQHLERGQHPQGRGAEEGRRAGGGYSARGRL